MNSDRKLPQTLTQRIFDAFAKSKPFVENVSLPRTTNITIPPSTILNICFTLYFMHHTVHGRQNNILVLLKICYRMIRLSLIENYTAETSFTYYLSLLISIFDVPLYTFVDLGTNIAPQYMEEHGWKNNVVPSNHSYVRYQPTYTAVLGRTNDHKNSFTARPTKSFYISQLRNPC